MPNAAQPEALNIEIVAATVRYARGALGARGAKAILSQLSRDFPEASEPQIRQAMGDAARRLLQQHSAH